MNLPIICKISVTLAIILFSGCAGQDIQWQRAAMQHQGQPPAYVDGYGDGYSSGTRAAGNPYFQPYKNVNRYISDPLYKQGWDDGYDCGKTRYTNLGRY